MSLSKDPLVTVAQAAQTIFGTRSPSVIQMRAVIRLLRIGELPFGRVGDDPLKWATTEEGIADFLARRQLKRVYSSGDRRACATERGSPAPSALCERARGEELRGVYFPVLRKKVLDALRQRRLTNRSERLDRAVLIGQGVALLVIVGALLFMGIGTISPTSLPWGSRATPEQLTITAWIAERTDDFDVLRWHTPIARTDGEGTVVRVEYRYRKDSPRWIRTDRSFDVFGDRVSETMDED